MVVGWIAVILEAIQGFLRGVLDAAKMIWDALPGFIKFAVFLAVIGLAGNLVSQVVGATSTQVCWDNQIYTQKGYIPGITQIVSTLGLDSAASFRAVCSRYEDQLNSRDINNPFIISVKSSWFIPVCVNSTTGRILDSPSCLPPTTLDCVKWLSNCQDVSFFSPADAMVDTIYCTADLAGKFWDNSTQRFQLNLNCSNVTWLNSSAQLTNMLKQDFQASNVTTPPVIGLGCVGTCTPTLTIMGVDIFNLNYWMIGLLIYFLVFSIRWMSQSGLFDR